MADKEKLQRLHDYSACDISDALLKLKIPGAGFLPDIVPYAPNPPHSPALASASKIIAPASTVLFVPLNWHSAHITNNIPKDVHYVDLTQEDTIVVLSQLYDQTCAVLGGIMATRMQVRGALGVVANGRIRDLKELRALDFPIYAKGTSTVGTGAQVKPWAINIGVTIGEVTVRPGNIIFADPLEGVVVIPQDRLDEVLELLPKLTAADEKVIEDVKKGDLVKEAFAKYR